MGWFGKIGRAIGRAIGGAVEWVGTTTGSTFLMDVGSEIQDFCTEKIASEKSYDKTEANINMTARLSDTLSEFSEGYFKQATSMEHAYIREVEQFYEWLIETVEEGLGKGYNKAALNNGRKRIEREISGSIKNPLARRMSLDDAECLKILKMDSGTEKKEAMSKFTRKVINEASDNLSKSVRQSINDQMEEIEEYLNAVLDEQENELMNAKSFIDNLCKKDLLDEKDKEKSCVAPLIILAAVNEVRKNLEEAV